MFGKNLFAGLIALSFILLPKVGFSEGVTFNTNPIPISATVGQAQTINLTQYINAPATGTTITWAGDSSMPSWITVNSGAQTMTIAPVAGDIGQFKFNLSATPSNDSGAIAQVVVTVSGPPVWSQSNIDLGVTNEETTLTFNLAPFVSNPAGGTLTFTATGLQPWQTISAAGVITGTPGRANVGNYSGITITATGPGGSSTATAYGTVLEVLKAPTWVSNPVTIANVNENSPYSVNVLQYVVQNDGTNFVFSKVSGPAWATVNADGTVLGTPGPGDVGPVSLTVAFTAKATDSAGTTNFPATSTVFNFTVNKVNYPPQWVADPLNLPQGATTVAYSQNLAGSVTDQTPGAVLTFTMTGNPTWLSLTPQGVLSGTPTTAGAVSFQATVTDQNGLSNTTTIDFTVIQTPMPPKWITPIVLNDAKQGSPYTADLNPFVSNPTNLPLTFTLMSGPTWATVSSIGVFGGTPGAANVGVGEIFSVQVSNSAGSDIANVVITVDPTNYPPTWILNPIHVSVNENAPMNINVAGYAQDPNVGQTMTFQIMSGASWATISPAGVVTGTPPVSAEGNNSFDVRAQDGTGLYADTTLIITVLHVNTPPVWSQNPITLPAATEYAAYTTSIASYATGNPGTTLTFSLVSGPTWISVASNGTITGTPEQPNVGANTFTVRVTDSNNLYADVTVNVNVIKVNRPPRWRQNPIQMTNANEGQAYTFDLTPFAVDDDGNPITFSLVSGPKWMSVSPAGIVSGTPKYADVGAFTAVFAVTDNFNQSAQATGQASVIHVPQAPVIATIPTITVKERQTLQVNLAQYVTDPDGLTDTYSQVSTLDFTALSATGTLSLTPKHPDIGSYTYNFSVTNGQLAAQGTINIVVQRDPQVPVWLQNPINMTAKTNIPFTGSLATSAQDLDGYTLTFSVTAGPSWLKVSAAGALSGTPLNADLGTETFTVQACNPYALCATASLIIKVVPGTQTDTVQIDTPVKGAKAENLWVIDSSNLCSLLMDNLRNTIQTYFDALAAAGLHDTGIYLSADAHKWDGLPIHDNSQNMLMMWSDPDRGSDFNARMDWANNGDPGTCGNCFNSPIWSMLRLDQRATDPELAQIYQNGFWDPYTPMDVMIISQQRDHYPTFAKGTPQASFTPDDYATYFKQFSAQQKQPYRISVTAPACPRLVTTQPAAAGDEDAYQDLVTDTNGQYYTLSACGDDLTSYLADYAQKVIFRAYVNANGTIKLTKTPIDATTIQVTLGGTALPAADWTYDATNNQVIINWYLIDQSTLTPGEQIAITYRVS